ncbi:hypothetical protein Moror_9320 [Moniliophthora roreri MCA 2997]|uniref:Uncharacterized protein n=1 Tax=Moniliophthora roreri (strain MCA 2997) TaxID=1381753 RepID=V2X140_MONRO|nr:hypothetical protein Moror_9320 [Moniliophthora roreri MCA 2997]
MVGKARSQSKIKQLASNLKEKYTKHAIKLYKHAQKDGPLTLEMERRARALKEWLQSTVHQQFNSGHSMKEFNGEKRWLEDFTEDAVADFAAAQAHQGFPLV